MALFWPYIRLLLLLLKHSHFKMKVLRALMPLSKTVLYLNVYPLCCGDTLQTPKICAAVPYALTA